MLDTTLDALADLLRTLIYLPLLLTGFDSLVPENSSLGKRLKRQLYPDKDT